MAEMIRKIVTCEVKEVAERTLEFIGSTETVDRDGEVIIAKGWDLKNYKKNPVFMWAHRYADPPIGKTNKVWVDNGQLKFNVEFADRDTYEFADTIYKLYQGGFLKATSVGFIPDPDSIVDGDGEKSPKRTYNKQELLELSGVPVPSNPDALIQARETGLITVKELNAITKPEETDDWVRIPVAECEVTATIDISKKEGIKALYCGKEKKVRTYMFDKRPPYNWTMERAKKWVEDHKGKSLDEILEEYKQETYQCECIKCGYKMESEKHCRDIKCPECGGEMRRIERPGPGQEEADVEEVKGAIPYKRTPLADEGVDWDAAREVREAEVEDLKIMCAIVEGDPENKTSYKLPHHKASGDHACVWRGVAASAAVLMGARGGVQASPESIAGAKAHIAKHYKDFDKGEPPWEKGITQAELGDELDYLIRLIETEGMNEEVKGDAWNLVREVMRLTGAEIPDDILAKVGAVLSAKNRENLKQAQSLIQGVLDSAESERELVIEPETKPSPQEIAEAVVKVIKIQIDKMQGKVT